MSKKTPTTRAGTVPITYRPDREKWELSIYADGKRKRTLHKTEDEAEKAWRSHCYKLKRFGTGSAFSPNDERELREARRIIPGVDLREAARFYRLHHPEGAESSTVAESVAAFMDHQSAKGISARYLAGMRQHLEAFARVNGSRPVRSVTGNEILEWLHSLGLHARTVQNYAGSLSTWLNWCERRNLVAVSPASSIGATDLPQPRPKPKGVLTVDQCAALMGFLDREAPRYAAWHALQLFAGIRRAEVSRIRWEWVDLDRKTITLPGWTEGGERVVKTGDDWVLHDLPENLWPWLEKYQWKGRLKSPGNASLERLRGERLPAIGIPDWPKNALRHTFCTMLMSLHGDAAKVANWSRHTNPAQLYRSYVARLVSREEAGRFAGILPHQAKPAPPP